MWLYGIVLQRFCLQLVFVFGAKKLELEEVEA
jgi:hypothetical protein